MDSRLVSLCLVLFLGCGGGGASTSAAPQAPRAGRASEGGSNASKAGSGGGRAGSGATQAGSTADRDASSPNGGSQARPPATGTERDAANVFLSGHSLFNLVMPAMLDQTARALGQSHNYNLQIGLGSSMKARLSGMGNEQDRDGKPLSFDIRQEIPSATTIGSGNKYDTLVTTEAVPIMTQLLFADTIGNLRTFYDLLMQSDPQGTVYLFDSWPQVESDFSTWVQTVRSQFVVWECIASVVSRDPGRSGNPVQLAPAGIVLADLVEAIDNGVIAGLSDPAQLFDNGSPRIHASNLGNYYIALVMYATIYGRSPVGAPRSFDVPNGGMLEPLVSDATATTMATFAWDRVSAFRERGPHNDLSMSDCRTAVRNFCTNIDCGNRVDNAFAD